MKIQIASDLHLEMHHDGYPRLADSCPVVDRDVLVLAGDIGVYTHALQFIEDEAQILPVIYVPGNHEYHTDWDAGQRTISGGKSPISPRTCVTAEVILPISWSERLKLDTFGEIYFGIDSRDVMEANAESQSATNS